MTKSWHYDSATVIYPLYQSLGRSRISCKIIADNGSSKSGINIDAKMIPGPEESAGITDKNIVFYCAVGCIEKRDPMLRKVFDSIVPDINICMVFGVG